MANWNGLVMTDKGIALQSKVQAGEVLNITKLKLGSGTLPAETDIRKLTDLIKPEQNLGIGGREPNGDYCKISATISNVGLEAGYYVRELGVFAQDPDDGEILYAYTTDGAPDYLPAEGSSTVISQEFSVNIAVSDTDKINVEIDPGALATMGYVQLQVNEHNEDASAHEKAFSQHNTDETAHYDMTGATGSKAGKRGFVPAPKAGDQNKALFGNGTYKQVVETINGVKPNENNDIDLNMKFFNDLAQISLEHSTVTWKLIYDNLSANSTLTFPCSSSDENLKTPLLELPSTGTFKMVVNRSDKSWMISISAYQYSGNSNIPALNLACYHGTAGFSGWKRMITTVNGITVADNGNVDLNQKFFNDLTQIGVSYETATWQTIFAALPVNSTITFYAGNDFPAGSLVIPHAGTFLFEATKGKATNYPMYINAYRVTSDTSAPMLYKAFYSNSVQFSGWHTLLDTTVDFSNTDFVVETYRSGTSWYRKYKSGWLEQGGRDSMPTGTKIITFPEPFADTDYTILGGSTGNTNTLNLEIPSTKKTTSVEMDYSNSATGDFYWYACGQGV